MQFSSSFVRSVYVAVMLASAASALPHADGLKHRMMRRAIEEDKVFESFYPESLFQTFGVEGIDHPLSARAEFNLEDAALSFVESRLKVTSDVAAFSAGYANDVVQHAYVHQQINGIPIANAVANIAFNKENKVISFGSSFVETSAAPSTVPSISAADAIAKAESELSAPYNGHPTKLEFVAKPDGSLVLTYVVQIQDDDRDMWFEAFVDAHSGSIVQLTDFVSHASYRVLPIFKQDITQGFATLINPQNTVTSPLGWHDDGTIKSTDTSGNNAVSYFRALQNTTTQSSATLNFIYVQDPTKNPGAIKANIDAARVNTFYIVNTMHDIAYLYGFKEAAFNFQNNNFNKGGKGNDRIRISVQDPSGKNNAFFTTPPDGQNGQMRMFIFDITNPQRDGALSNDVVVHETTHGITNRMTGGGTARCLQTLEARGLGEGWSDAMAEWTEWTNSTIHDFTLGSYLINNPRGIRSHPYSTSRVTNPLMYSNLKTLNEEHNIGEVWANMLHNVYAQLVGARGFSATAKTNPNTNAGNTIFLHLFLDALALQPCNPNFVQARAAWIQADANRYQGRNRCLLWRAFASRGLGVNATTNHNDNMSVPPGC